MFLVLAPTAAAGWLAMADHDLDHDHGDADEGESPIQGHDSELLVRN